MSQLSSLLNPAPNPDANSPASPTQPLTVDGRNSDHNTDVSGDRAHMRNESPRLPTLTSPLEALAAAATSSAPMLSPSNPNGTPFMTLGAHQQSLPHPLSRPTSSHTSPPPPFDFARTSDLPAPTFSPGLEQYHHSTSREVRVRRMSDTDDSSTVLAPLRGTLPNERRQSPVPLHTIQSSTIQQTHSNNMPIFPQIQQPSPGSTLHPVITTLPETRHELVEVKAEITEDPPELRHDMRQNDPQPASLQDAIPVKHSQTKEEMVVSKGLADSKNAASYSPSPNTTEGFNPTKSATPKPAPTKKRAAPKKGTASAVKHAAKKRKIETESIDGTLSVQRSVTPASSRASKAPAPKNRRQDSATPTRSSSVGQQEDDEDMDDESALFCICRKPDDHTWMIGCDGPCEDWFHGRCVNMNEEDGKIIDKWICTRDVFSSSGNC